MVTSTSHLGVFCFFLFLCSLLSSVQNQRLEKDSVVPSVLVLPKEWRGEVNQACSYSAPSSLPLKSYVVRNHLYSFVTSSQNKIGELYVRPLDDVYEQGCRSQSNTRFLTFSKPVWAFSTSPEQDLSILTTTDDRGATLMVTFIDAKDLYVNQKIFSVDVMSRYSTSGMRLATTFLNNRFVLIQLSNNNVAMSVHYVLDTTTREVRKLPTLEISITNEKDYVIYTTDKITQHFVYFSSRMNAVISYRFDPLSPFYFTQEWKSYVSSVSQMMYHTGLNKIIVLSYNLNILDAATGSRAYETSVNRGSSIVGGVGNIFYVYDSATIYQYTYNPSTRNCQKTYLTSFNSIKSVAVSRSNELYVFHNYYSTDRLTVIRDGRSDQIAITFNSGVVESINSTNHYFLVLFKNGGYSLYTPSSSRYPTPNYYPTPFIYRYSSSWWDPLWVKMVVIGGSAIVGVLLIVMILLRVARRSRQRQQAVEECYPGQLLQSQNMTQVNTSVSTLSHPTEAEASPLLPSPPDYLQMMNNNTTMMMVGPNGYSYQGLTSKPEEKDEDNSTSSDEFADAVEDHEN